MDWIVGDGVEKIPDWCVLRSRLFCRADQYLSESRSAGGSPAVGESVAILGQGPIGLMFTMLVRRTGARMFATDTFRHSPRTCPSVSARSGVRSARFGFRKHDPKGDRWPWRRSGDRRGFGTWNRRSGHAHLAPGEPHSAVRPNLASGTEWMFRALIFALESVRCAAPTAPPSTFRKSPQSWFSAGKYLWTS